MALALRLPGPPSALHVVDGEAVFGRGKPPALRDPFFHRQHFTLAPGMVGGDHVLSVDILGPNALVVEARDAAVPGGWRMCSFLEKGSHGQIAVGQRFYVDSRKDSTMFHVVRSPDAEAAEEAAAAAAIMATGAQRAQMLQSAAAITDTAAAVQRASFAKGVGSAVAPVHSISAPLLPADPTLNPRPIVASAVAAGAPVQLVTLPAGAAGLAAVARMLASEQSAAAPPIPSIHAHTGEPGTASMSVRASCSSSLPEVRLQVLKQARPIGVGRQTMATQQQTRGVACSIDMAAGAVIDVDDVEELVQPVVKRQRLNDAGPSKACPGVPEANAAKHTLAAPFAGVADVAPFALTWVRGLPEQHNSGCAGARFSDLLCGPIKTAWVSSYLIMLDWLLEAYPTLVQAGRCMVVHGMQGSATDMMHQQAAAAGATNMSIFAPPLPISYGTHHTKAFILEYAAGLRVVIHTSNLRPQDCSLKTQALWYQDFPPKAVDGGSGQRSSPFEQQLSAYLAALRMPKEWSVRMQALVRKHDFSCARAALLASVPGYHSGPALHAYGHMRVRALLSQEPLPDWAKDAPLVAQCSSLGALEESWLLNEWGASFMASKLPPAGSLQRPLPPLHAAKLSLVWPTVEEVRNCMEGWEGGSSIPGYEKNVGKPFLAKYFCHWAAEPSGRQRAGPHIKSYCRHAGQRLLWSIITSSNMSRAAWGQLQKNQSQLMIRSYELGLLLLPSMEAAYLVSPQAGFTCTPHHPQTARHLPTRAMRAERVQGGPSCSSNGTPVAGAAQIEVQFWTLAASDEFAGRTTPPSNASGHTTGQAEGLSAGSEQLAGNVAADGPCNRQGVIRVLLPVPYSLPPQRYSKEDQPWMWDVLYHGVDILGRLMVKDAQGGIVLLQQGQQR